MGVVGRPSRPIEPGAIGEEMILPAWLRLLAATAKHQPAILGPGERVLSYRDLDALRRNLQACMARLGLGSYDRIAVVMPVGPMAAALVAATAASAACVPLNPAYVERELTAAFSALRVRAVIADPEARAAIASAATLGLAVLSPAELTEIASPHDASISTPGCDDIALLLHTSGTSARPKVVALSHATILGIARKLIDWFALTPQDRCLNLMPVYNAHGTEAALFSTLFSGGSIVCLPGFTTSGFFDALRTFEPTWYTGGATFNHAIASALDEAPHLAARGRLRFLRSGSGPLPARARQTLEDAFGAPMIESYAMTEAGVITANPLDRCKPGTAGIPIAEEVAIVDEAGAPLPKGQSGQIIIRGPLVASRYENDPESSAAAFKDGWLLTGDQGYFDDDGYLVINGRIKELVSRGGDKISPVEVETILMTHPDVRECVVFGIPHPTLGEELGAAVVLRRGALLSAEDLRNHVMQALAAYKVPRTIKLVDAIPKTAAGKVARRGMHAHFGLAANADQGEARRAYTPLEAALAGIWGTLLKREAIAPDQDFFLLGGDSLLATRLLNSVREVFGADLPVRALFGEAATIAGMAGLIEAARKAPLERSAAASVAESDSGSAPLSFAQQRLWFLQRLHPASVEYNVPWALRLRGTLDAPVLARALDALIQRHHCLRTRFVAIAGEPRQIVDAAATLTIDFHDLTDFDDAHRPAELERLGLRQVREPFDLTKSPLLRVTLVRQAADDHVLLVTVHHIIFDRWSMAVFRDDLAALYEEIRSGVSAALPALTMQYPAYAAWQRAAFSAAEASAQLAYWRAKLAGVSSDLALPFDRPRPTVRSGAGAGERTRLDAALLRSLKALARRSGATLFMVLLAGLQALLRRYTGQGDFVIGSPVAGRRRAEVESLIGFFVNTLVLRADLSGDPTFEELIGRVRRTAVEAFANQDLPFERLIEELKPERHVNRPPLIQIVFALQNVPSATRTMAGLTAEPCELHNEASKFDLVFTAVEQGDGLDLTVSYDSDLFDSATIHRLMGHYRNLLTAGASEPGLPISLLPLLSEDEHRQIAIAWNQTVRPFPASQRLESLFSMRARHSPGRRAVVADDLRLSYAELDALSDAWAAAIAERGARAGRLVGLCMERSGAMIVALLAVLKTGCAYIPLDSGQPARRLQQVVQDAAPDLLLVDSASEAAVRGFGVVCLRVGAELPLAPDGRSVTPPFESGGEAPACVLFTSGSTGQPKGVVIPHRAVARLVVNTDFVEFRENDIVGQGAHASFDAALLEIWGGLLNGACVTVLPREVLLDPAALRSAIEDRRVTVLFLTTALFNQVARRMPGAFPTLRCLMFGGEPADLDAIRSVLESGYNGALLNGYGPTEATTFATTYDVRGLTREATRVPVGRPIANTEVYILDERRRPAPIGAVGEVFIGGPGLAAGYLNAPALTAERFLSCEIVSGSPVRLYRTGDLGRYLPDGTIDLLGRIDGQIKIRGFRIEPGEIVAALRRHPAIREAAVLARSYGGDTGLVAYLVSAAEMRPTDGDLRAFLSRELPGYMVPRAFVWLDTLPIGATGKVDHGRLPTSDAAGSAESGHVCIAPRTALEHQLVSIWEELLGISPIGITDNFFDLGGHSLLAVRMIDEIERLCGRALPVSTLFAAANIAQLALIIRSKPPAASKGLLLELKRDGEHPPFFFLHGDYINGGFYCRKIADHLSPDQPMVALLPHGIDGTPVPPTIEAMAEAYIALMREHQPQGPYRLGGSCNGGLIAYEIARQLTSAGEAVERLIMIEPPDWNLPFLMVGAQAISARLPSRHSRNLRLISVLMEGFYAMRPRLNYYRRRMHAFHAASPREKLRFVTRKLVRSEKGSWDPRVEPPRAAAVTGAVPELDRLPDLYVDAIKRYRPGTFDGRTLYIATHEEVERGSINPKLWRRVAGNLTISVLPGNHQSIATRHVVALTGAINEYLMGMHR